MPLENKKPKLSASNNGNSLVDENDGVTIEGALAEAAEDVCKAESKIKEYIRERVDGHSKHHRNVFV